MLDNALKSFGTAIEKEKRLDYQEVRKPMSTLLQGINMTRIVSIVLHKG